LQIGHGSRFAASTTNFAFGALQSTGNPFDVAINGGGFFRMSNNGNITYTRNGQFQVDKSGYIVDSGGCVVMIHRAVRPAV
jgi:flagellar hook protein FlgE